MSTTPVTPAAPPAPTLPPEIYAIFCGGMEQAAAQKIVGGLTYATANQVRHAHILYQSSGGLVGDGVFLYNLFRSLPIELTLNNVGAVMSAALVAKPAPGWHGCDLACAEMEQEYAI